jgi:hypothetical protein
MLPQLLEGQTSFPFFVVSPLRDEECLECWDREENVRPLFELRRCPNHRIP